MINGGFLIPISTSQLVISNKWSKDLQSPLSSSLRTLDSYLILSQPQSAVYIITSKNKKIDFSYALNGQNYYGTNLVFSFELSPSRYFLTKKFSWGTRKLLEIQNARWNLATDVLPSEINIQNVAGQIWTNSYPLMHRMQLEVNEEIEEFVFDNYFEVESTNSINHNALLYKIIPDNISNIDNSAKIWHNVFVSII